MNCHTSKRCPRFRGQIQIAVCPGSDRRKHRGTTRQFAPTRLVFSNPAVSCEYNTSDRPAFQPAISQDGFRQFDIAESWSADLARIQTADSFRNARVRGVAMMQINK